MSKQVRYLDQLPSDDPRRFDNSTCAMCGLLEEFQTNPQILSMYSHIHGQYFSERTCSIKCKEAYLDFKQKLQDEK